MRKQVNATRMELLRLRRRTVLARKGHKLLKDKLDGLIQQLFEIAKQQSHLSGALEEQLVSLFQQLALSSAQIRPETIAEAIPLSSGKATLSTVLQNRMGVKIPKYELKLEGNPFSYNLIDTPGEFDQALLQFQALLGDLVKLAELNKAIEIMAGAIIEIKRRVNALEYILIPELEEQVRYIRMKLTEMERSTIVTLLKIKDSVRAH